MSEYGFNRRTFLKRSILAATGAFACTAPLSAIIPAQDAVKITVLHTNDVHSRIDPFPEDGTDYAGRAGFAPRAALINQIRTQEKNVLLLDAGDIFQGTPYFNFFGGEPELKLMSELKYDAATMGNHDFDNGLDGFNKVIHHADFPFLTANYDFTDTQLAGKTQPNAVFKFDDVKVGVYGIGIRLKGLVPDHLFGNTRYLDPLTTAKQQEKQLKYDHKCDLIIGLSHLGYKYNQNNKVSDRMLAANTASTDLIIGGHTHTFMQAPERLTNAAGRRTLIFQVGWAGINLGRVDFYVNPYQSRKEAGGRSIPVNKKYPTGR